MKKVLLFGPIGDFGGREVEAGFIAKVLSAHYQVAVCSTEPISRKSQVFTFNSQLEVFSLNDLLCKRFFSMRLLAVMNFLFNGGKGMWSKQAQNSISKKYFGYQTKINAVRDRLLATQDLIFICGQLSSNYVKEVVEFAYKNHKKVIFRTTGTISNATHYPYLDQVDCFIHHSLSNAAKIKHLTAYRYEIIDQCAFNETALLQIKPGAQGCRKFLVLTRLSHEKGLDQIIEYFLRVCTADDVLYIAGNGSLEDTLKDKYQNPNICFLGFVAGEKLVSTFATVDCLIIPSPEESGPLVGIEAMCAGKVILSTKVGAMPERLHATANNFWYDYGDFESFAKAFEAVRSMTAEDQLLIFNSLRERYQSNYTIRHIGEQYQNIVKQTLN